MNRPALACSLLLLLAGLAFAAPALVRADASPALQNVLAEMRALSNPDFTILVKWAKKAPEPTATPLTEPQQTEANILALDRADRRAVLAWLTGNGRSALYASGATDDQIGPRYRLLTPSPGPTSNGWRYLFAGATPGETIEGNVQILGGFTAVRGDGTAAVACVSFKNLAPMAANRIVVDFPLVAASGVQLGVLRLDRRGQFAPNERIVGLASLNERQQNNPAARVRAQNCIEQELQAPALAILQARFTGFHVVRVEYVDRTIWPSGAPPATPTP